MNASPLFIKVRLCLGGVEKHQSFAFVDVMQIVAMVEINACDPAVSKDYPALDIVLMGGYSLKCWDEDRTGVNEVNELKAKFVRAAMNPSILTPQQMAAGMR